MDLECFTRVLFMVIVVEMHLSSNKFQSNFVLKVVNSYGGLKC